MRNYSILFMMLIAGLVSELCAQDCAGTAYGNTFGGANGRYFIMTYDDEADRDAALALINSITIDGSTYNVNAHPTGSRSIRTTPAQPAGTFPASFTGVVTLNPSSVACNYTASVLPISLSYFNAEIENSKVIIKWETAQESNNKGFEVQKSTDGVNFVSFKWVDGAGSSSQSTYYEVRHTDFAKGTNYYRFKQIDYDGTFEFSPIVAVNIESNNVVRLESTVLTQGQEVILLNAYHGAYEVVNAAGNKISSGFIEGQYQILSTAGYNAGVYFIRTEGGNTLRFIIK